MQSDTPSRGACGSMLQRRSSVQGSSSISPTPKSYVYSSMMAACFVKILNELATAVQCELGAKEIAKSGLVVGTDNL